MSCSPTGSRPCGGGCRCSPGRSTWTPPRRSARWAGSPPADRRPDRRAGGQEVHPAEGQGTARYRLLDTIREFGLTKLRGRGQRARTAAAAPGDLRGAGRAAGCLRDRACLMDRRAQRPDPRGLAVALWSCLRIRRRRPRARRSPVTCGGTGSRRPPPPRDAASWRHCSTSSAQPVRPGSGSCGPPGSSASSQAELLPPGGCRRPAVPQPARRAM